MNYVTVGQVHNKDKVAQIRCVENTPLKEFFIKDESFLLVILKQGKVRFSVCDQTFTAVAPCFVCFDQRENPRVISRSHAMADAVYFHPSFLNVNMTFDLLRSAQYEDVATQHDMFMLRPFTERTGYIPIEQELLRRIETLFENMARELSLQRDWYWSCRSRSYFMELLLLVERLYGAESYGVDTEAPDNAFSSQTPDLKRALLYIESNYEQEYRLSDIADACGMTTAALSALFKKELHKTPLEYGMEYRIKVAKKQLAFTDIPIKEISLRCGFKTVPHFSRVFKEQTGSTPAQYRKETVENRKRAMNTENLITYARERLNARDIVFESPDLPQVCVCMAPDGSVCEYTGVDGLKLYGVLSKAGIARVAHLVCVRKSGALAMPPLGFLSVLKQLDDVNQNTRIHLQDRDGYYTKTVAEVLQKTDRKPRFDENGLQALYKELLEKQTACLDPDWLLMGIRMYRDIPLLDELLTEVADFLEDHTAFAVEQKRYLAFENLPLAPSKGEEYYRMVYALLTCAERDADPDAMERVYSLPPHPLLFTVMDRGVAKLQSLGCPEHATRLREYVDRLRREYRMMRRLRYESDVVDVVFTETERRQLQYENGHNNGSFTDVIVIGCYLNVGDIRGEIDGNARVEVLAQLEPAFTDKDGFRTTVRRDYERLRSAAESGKPIRVWRNLREPHNACGFALVCETLREIDCLLTVVDCPEGMPSWAVVSEHTMHLLLEQEVTREDKFRFADMWREMVVQNAPLRAYVGDTLVSLSSDHYDDILTALFPDSAAALVAERIGRLLAPENAACQPPYTVYLYRLEALIERGVLEIVIDDDDPLLRVIRRKTDEPYTVADVITVARAFVPRVRDGARAAHLPAPQVSVMLSATGRFYIFENDDVQGMTDTLTKVNDTFVTYWATLWADDTRRFDVPSYAARQALLKLDGRNAQTQLIFEYSAKQLSECL